LEIDHRADLPVGLVDRPIRLTDRGDFQQLAEKYWPILSNDEAVKLAIEDPSIWHFAARQYLRTRKLLAEYRQGQFYIILAHIHFEN
jgi:hypothetical protein